MRIFTRLCVGADESVEEEGVVEVRGEEERDGGGEVAGDGGARGGEFGEHQRVRMKAAFEEMSKGSVERERGGAGVEERETVLLGSSAWARGGGERRRVRGVRGEGE